VQDNWPELRSTVTELSPFYLQEARGNMRRWKELRAADRQLGGVDGTGTAYIQCAVERMPLDDESQDIVSSPPLADANVTRRPCAVPYASGCGRV
jgi:hypothetical protein